MVEYTKTYTRNVILPGGEVQTFTWATSDSGREKLIEQRTGGKVATTSTGEKVIVQGKTAEQREEETQIAKQREEYLNLQFKAEAERRAIEQEAESRGEKILWTQQVEKTDSTGRRIFVEQYSPESQKFLTGVYTGYTEAQAREQREAEALRNRPKTKVSNYSIFGGKTKTPDGRISAVTKSDYLVNQPESLFIPKKSQAVFGPNERVQYISGEALLQQQKEYERQQAYTEDTSFLKGSAFDKLRKAFYEYSTDYPEAWETKIKSSQIYQQVPEIKLITAVGFGAIEGARETSKLVTYPLKSLDKAGETLSFALESPQNTAKVAGDIFGNIAQDPARFGGSLLGSAVFFKSVSTLRRIDPVFRSEQKLAKELTLVEKNIKTGGKSGKPFEIDYAEIVTPPKRSTSYSPETKIKTSVYQQIPTSTYVGYGSTKDLIIKDLIDVPNKASYRIVQSPKYPKARIEILSDFEAGTQTTSFFYATDDYSKLNPLRKTTTPLKSSFDDLVTGIKQSKFSAEILEGTKKKKTLTQLDKTYYQFQTADGSVRGISENLLKQDIRLMKPAREFKVGSGVRFDTGTKAITEYTISKKALPTEVDFGKSLKQYDTLNLKSDPFALIRPNKAYGFDITGNRFQAPRVRSTTQQAYSNVFRWSSAPYPKQMINRRSKPYFYNKQTPITINTNIKNKFKKSKTSYTEKEKDIISFSDVSKIEYPETIRKAKFIGTENLYTGSGQSAVLQQPKLQTQQVVTQRVPISRSKTYSGLTRTKSAIKYQTKFSTMTKSKSLLSTKSALATSLLTRNRSKTLLQQQTTPLTQLKSLTQTKTQTRLKTEQLLDLRLRQQQMTQQLTTTSVLSSKAVSLPKSPNFPKFKPFKPTIPIIPSFKLDKKRESSRSTFKSKSFKQRKAYTPSVTAVLNKLTGSTSEAGLKSGLAIRPIQIK